MAIALPNLLSENTHTHLLLLYSRAKPGKAQKIHLKLKLSTRHEVILQSNYPLTVFQFFQRSVFGKIV